MDIREFIKIIEQAGEGSKLNRNTFLYMDPKDPEDTFAQCATCIHFLPDAERCLLFSENDEVIAEGSCGLYAHGTPEDNRDLVKSTTPEEAGYIVGQVRCENCSWFNKDSTCGVYQELNKLKDIFDLDVGIDPKGCCNAFQK